MGEGIVSLYIFYFNQKIQQHMITTDNLLSSVYFTHRQSPPLLISLNPYFLPVTHLTPTEDIWGYSPQTLSWGEKDLLYIEAKMSLLAPCPTISLPLP